MNMANSAVLLQNVGDVESELNIFLGKYNLSLLDISIANGDGDAASANRDVLIAEVISVVNNLIESQFQTKLSGKRVQFDLELKQFTYMFQVYCSGECRDNVLPHCVSFLNRFNLSFSDFVVSSSDAIACVVSMLEKIITRAFESKCVSRIEKYRQEKERELVLLKKYLEEKVCYKKSQSAFAISFADLISVKDASDISSDEEEQKCENSLSGAVSCEQKRIESCVEECISQIVHLSNSK
jgi:hypothetical protein